MNNPRLEQPNPRTLYPGQVPPHYPLHTAASSLTHTLCDLLPTAASTQPTDRGHPGVMQGPGGSGDPIPTNPSDATHAHSRGVSRASPSSIIRIRARGDDRSTWEGGAWIREQGSGAYAPLAAERVWTRQDKLRATERHLSTATACNTNTAVEPATQPTAAVWPATLPSPPNAAPHHTTPSHARPLPDNS